MDTSRDRTAGSEGSAASIRLRYSRQFQHNGHTHSIDAEATLPVGAHREAREQVIREVEAGVDQLARQIVQHSVRNADERRSPPAPRAETTGAAAPSPAPPANAHRSAEPAAVASPPTRMPVSETMPVAPTAVGERTVRLADFINVIKRYWDMSPQDAMRLLKVKSLDGLNYREAFNSLKTLVDSGERGARPQVAQSAPTRPVIEAPRQNRRLPTAPSDARSSTNQATSSGLQAQGQAALKESTLAGPLPTTPPPLEAAPPQAHRHDGPSGTETSGTSKTSLPIQPGVVHDLSARTSYGFAEEDEPASSDAENTSFTAEQNAARAKLSELKAIRGSSAASAQRLHVLHNVVGEQISATELLNLVQGIWSAGTLKKLKNEQAESLISWAKGDYFADEAQVILTLLAREEEE